MIEQKLYKIDSKGKIRVWYVLVHGDQFITYAGILDGKLVEKITTCKPKNVGQKNETTGAEQALKEAESKWKKKHDRELYTTELPKPGEETQQVAAFISPMKALDATKVKHRIDFKSHKYCVQMKLNGVRCTAKLEDNKVTLTSRMGKNYNVPHVQEDILKLYRTQLDDSIILDGELYFHSSKELREITKAVHAKEFSKQQMLQFCAFDLAIPDLTFQDRIARLLSYDIRDLKYFTRVPSTIVYKWDDVKFYHDTYVQAGCEGVMIRDIDAHYQFGKRTTAMFKYKEFQDDEFEIIGVHPDKDSKGAVLEYKTESGKTFKARSKGTDEYRIYQLNHPKEFIGKLGTVRYSNILDSGVPEFPRGITIRDYE